MSFLYHVTYYNRLPSIATQGLSPNMPRSIGSPAYDSHSKGRLFLTEWEAVRFWADAATDFAHYHNDNVLRAGAIPVVLRVDVQSFQEDLTEDELGTRDAPAPAKRTGRIIPPDYLEVWGGDRWVPVKDWGLINPEDAVYADEWFNEDSEQDVVTYHISDDSPLLPKMAVRIARLVSGYQASENPDFQGTFNTFRRGDHLVYLFEGDTGLSSALLEVYAPLNADKWVMCKVHVDEPIRQKGIGRRLVLMAVQDADMSGKFLTTSGLFSDSGKKFFNRLVEQEILPREVLW